MLKYGNKEFRNLQEQVQKNKEDIEKGIGIPGPQGPQGPVGPEGPMGPVGPDGHTGPQGPQGPMGPKGPQGIQGPRGPRGEKGDPGEKGADGTVSFDELTPGQKASLKGEKGDKGDQGVKGEKGDPGENGAPGATGPQGPVGPQGPKGEKGDKGDKGDPGEGRVSSVNGKEGVVVLKAEDIRANNAATIQSNLERIDSEINRVEAEIPDVTGFATRDELQDEVIELNAAITAKQDALTAGDNITIENNVISADVTIPDNVVTTDKDQMISAQYSWSAVGRHIEVTPYDIQVHNNDTVGGYDRWSQITPTRFFIRDEKYTLPDTYTSTAMYYSNGITFDYKDGQVTTTVLNFPKKDGTYTLATTDDIPSVEGLASEQYVVNKIAEAGVTKQDKLDSYSDHATVTDNKLTINYKVRQEDNTYVDVPVEFEGGGGGDSSVVLFTNDDITYVKVAEAIEAGKLIYWKAPIGDYYLYDHASIYGYIFTKAFYDLDSSSKPAYYRCRYLAPDDTKGWLTDEVEIATKKYVDRYGGGEPVKKIYNAIHWSNANGAAAAPEFRYGLTSLYWGRTAVKLKFSAMVNSTIPLWDTDNCFIQELSGGAYNILAASRGVVFTENGKWVDYEFNLSNIPMNPSNCIIFKRGVAFRGDWYVANVTVTLDNGTEVTLTAADIKLDKIKNLDETSPVEETIEASTTILEKYQLKLTAGENITIDENNVISASGGGGSSYTFTNGLTETDGVVSWNLNDTITKPSSYKSLQIGKANSTGKLVANDDGAIAFGYNNTNKDIIASGRGTLAGGHAYSSGTHTYSNQINARGNGSVAIGYTFGGRIEATDNGSIAMGAAYGDIKAVGVGAVALGNSVEANGAGHCTVGKYNTRDTSSQYMFIVGNGTSEASRHNAFAVGNDNSITVGDTKITEAQLQALLAGDTVEGGSWVTAPDGWTPTCYFVEKRPGWATFYFRLLTNNEVAAATQITAVIDLSTLGLATKAVPSIALTGSVCATGSGSGPVIADMVCPEGAVSEGATSFNVRLKCTSAWTGSNAKGYMCRVDIPVKKA